MAIPLSQDDFDRLVDILSQHPDWRLPAERVAFMDDVFAGSSRRHDILTRLDLSGRPRVAAVSVITFLKDFGQDDPGRETLGVLINKLIASLGGGTQVEYLRDLMHRYPFTTRPVATRDVGDAWRGGESEASVAEKIIGENTLRDIFTLEVALDVARAVVRIQTASDLGTGFMIAPDLVMTNHHVIASAAAAEKSRFMFNYQLDRAGVATSPVVARALAGGLFHTSPTAAHNAAPGELDYTVIQLADAPGDRFAPLPLKPAAIKRDARLTIIQHPGGDYKKISMQNNFVEYVDAVVVQYTTSTEPGSSGSPVFNDDFDVVAIHHAGGNLREPTTARRYFRNEGIRMSAILDDLRANAPAIFERIAR